MVVNKKVSMELIGMDGNAFNLMGQFQKNARRQGWSKEDINSVLNECKKGDYNHLLCTLMDHVESPEEEEDDEDGYDEDDDRDDDYEDEEFDDEE